MKTHTQNLNLAHSDAKVSDSLQFNEDTRESMLYAILQHVEIEIEEQIKCDLEIKEIGVEHRAKIEKKLDSTREALNGSLDEEIRRIFCGIYHTYWTEGYFAVDYDHWAHRSHWTVDQSTALSLNCDPEQVLRKRVEDYPFSVFADRYRRIWGHINQAQDDGSLSRKPQPTEVIEWAEKSKCPFPEELKRIVFELSPPRARLRDP